MDYRRLGNSGLLVSALTMGTMTFGGAGKFAAVGGTDAAGARRQIGLARDAGVNLIDTADVYSDGESERIVGEVLEGDDELLVATKARFRTGPGVNGEGASRHHVIRSAEASLRRLRRDHIDLFQIHEWDGLTPLEETLGALDDLVRSGKVRYVGVSNFAGWQLEKALGTAERMRFAPVVSQQIHYTLQAREAEYEILPASIDGGVGVLVWSPLAGGLLSGKFRRDHQPPEQSRQLTEWNEPPVRDQEALYDIVEELVQVGEAHGVSAAQVALAWVLQRPGVASVIVGARTDEQLTDNLASADLKLTPAEVERLDAVSAPPVIYPFWHQIASASERLGASDFGFGRSAG